MTASRDPLLPSAGVGGAGQRALISIGDRRTPQRSFRRLPQHLAAIRVELTRGAQPLTREQAAALLDIHPRTLDRWAKLERIRVIDLGGTVRIPVDEAQRLLRVARSTPA